MKANMGLLPELPQQVRRKRDRYRAFSERARHIMSEFMQARGLEPLDLNAGDHALVTRLTEAPDPTPEAVAQA